jgi:uncharacterized membrane protein HdeD (DUF308 family)
MIGVVAGLFTILLGGVALFLPLTQPIQAAAVIGGLLIAAGVAELPASLRRAPGPLRTATLGSAIITTLAGLVLVAQPSAGLYPSSYVLTLWLLLRGALLLWAALQPKGSCPAQGLLDYSATADLALGAMLLLGLPIASLAVGIFGPTPEFVARFALVLAISLIVAGVTQVAVALAERREPGCETNQGVTS